MVIKNSKTNKYEHLSEEQLNAIILELYEKANSRECKVCQKKLTTLDQNWNNGKVYCKSDYYQKITKPKLFAWLNKQPSIKRENYDCYDY